MYIEDIHEAPIKMILPLIFLCFGSIFVGFLTRDLFIGLGSSFFSNSVSVFHTNLLLIDSEFSLAILKNIPLVFTIFGFLLAILLINCNISSKTIILSYKLSKPYRWFYTFLNKKWHLDQIANTIVAVKAMNFGYRSSFQIADKGVIELIGPFGTAINILVLTKFTSLFHSGYIFHYTLVMLFSIISIIAYSLSYNVFISVNGLIFVALVFLYSFIQHLVSV
jgi:NADH-ubiquinone oxidoreductase chain 5